MFASSEAHAEEQQPANVAAPSPAFALLQGELDLHAEEGRRQRIATNVTTATAAVALVPAGIVLWTRSNQLAKTIGIGMALGGGIPLVLVAPTLFPSKLERLRADVERKRAAGMPDAELLRFAETEWEDAAHGAHKRRVIVGIVDLTLGTAATATGLFFLLSGQIGNMSRDDQYTVGTSIAGTGVPLATFGIRSLVTRTLEETSWDAYRTAKRLGESRTEGTSSAPTAGITPLRGGAAAFMTFAF